MTQATRVHSTPRKTASKIDPTRRHFLTVAAAGSIAGLSPAIAAAMTSTSATDRRALEAYASWLFMERRILCGELWPQMGAEAERYVSQGNAGADWHFRGDGDWRDLPQPSTRAANVLDLVGVDWKQDREMSHVDTRERQPLPDGWPGIDTELVRAAQDLQAVEQAIDDLCRKYDEADGRDDYRALEDRRNENTATLITIQAKSTAGIQAKAASLRLRAMIADRDQHQQIAVSLADDLVRLDKVVRP
jgi:hypothetical protein